MKYLIILVCTMLLASCGGKTYVKPPSKTAQGFQPLEITLPVVNDYNDTIKGTESSKPEINKLYLQALGNDRVTVSISEVNNSGKVTYGTTQVSAADQSYKVYVDFMKYSSQTPYTICSIKKDAECSEYDDSLNIYYGIRIRLAATITTNKAGLDLGNLFVIGAAAERGEASGTLIVETTGISGSDITPLIPIPSRIDLSTIQNALQAVATIKSKIYMNTANVIITPQILGYAGMQAEDTDINESDGWIYLGKLDKDLLSDRTTSVAKFSEIATKTEGYHVLVDALNVRNTPPSLFKLGKKTSTISKNKEFKVLSTYVTMGDNVWAQIKLQ